MSAHARADFQLRSADSTVYSIAYYLCYLFRDGIYVSWFNRITVEESTSGLIVSPYSDELTVAIAFKCDFRGQNILVVCFAEFERAH